MRRMIHSALLAGVGAAALAFLAPTPGSCLQAQNFSQFPTPSGRYYNPYASGPYGSYRQGIGNAFSQGTPNMFSRGLSALPPPAYSSWPPTGPNLYQNQPYGGSFYARPMVGPSYDPFRNGRY